MAKISTMGTENSQLCKSIHTYEILPKPTNTYKANRQKAEAFYNGLHFVRNITICSIVYRDQISSENDTEKD